MSGQQYLKLNYRFGTVSHVQFLPIKQEQIIDQEVKLTAQEVLKGIRNFINQKGLRIENYLNIWVETKALKENIFKLKKSGKSIPLTPERGYFELNITIDDASDKANLIKNFQNNFDSYQKLKTNITKVIEESGPQQLERRGQSNNRPIDIAYFFADPLIKFSAKSSSNFQIMQTQRQVSFQVEYDNFIAMVQREEFRRNFRIEMMAATETNIRNTLLEGTSILHFSCHGDQKGNLHIEHEKNIGELAWLNHGKFMDLLSNGNMPKIIIFNACYSYSLAKKVSEIENIIAVGYDGEALDKICEQFTKKFYMGIFRDKKSIKDLFDEIKSSIVEKYPNEGSRLHIFPQKDMFQNMTIMAEPGLSNIEYKKRWKVLESLRKNDCLDVKQEMYKIIKAITNEQRMNYIILEGNQNAGKTNLIHKIKIYTINRKLFSDSLMIDLRANNSNQSRQTMLAFRMAFQAQISQFLLQIQRKRQQLKKGNISSLIVIDHAQNLILYQYSQLINYIEKELIDKLNFGQIVIINRKEEPFCKHLSMKYRSAYRIVKEEKDLDRRECQTFIKRYYGQQFWEEAKRIKDEKKVKWLYLIRAIKLSNESDQILGNLFVGKQKIAKIFELPLMDKTIEGLEKDADDILEDINYDMAEHHPLYLSTILKDIAGRGLRKTSLSQTQILFNKQSSVYSLVRGFKLFWTKAIEHQPIEAAKLFKRIVDLAFVIGGICYLTKCHRELHFLNCQTLYVMASVMLMNPFYELTQLKLTKSFSHGHEEEQPADPHFQDQPELQQVFKILNVFKLQMLLTTYTYYAEHSHQLESRKRHDSDLIENPADYAKKAEILMDELYTFIRKKDRKEVQLKSTFVTYYKQILHVLHHMQFGIQEAVISSSKRKYSDNIEESEEYIELLKQIHHRHDHIKAYEQMLNKVIEINGVLKILSRDSQTVFTLALIKLVKVNQTWLSRLNSYSPITRDLITYVDNYLSIMEKLKQSGTFIQQKGAQHLHVLWRYAPRSSAKQLFRTYYTMFVSAYFFLEKLSQSFSKNYNIKIFNYIIYMCCYFPKMNMVSLKKQVQTHKQQQFLSNYSCETFIALPLVNHNGDRVNMKRYQSHVYQFQDDFFNNLQREIRHDTFPLERAFFLTKQHNTKSLVQLLIVNCSEERIQCESVNGKGDAIKIQDIRNIPKSPVIILFGHKVRYLIDTFRNRGKYSVIITIDTDLHEEIRGSRREIRSDVSTEKEFMYGSSIGEKWKVKEDRLRRLQEYSNKLEVSYSILQFFYTSFCKHFFTTDHSVLIDQIRKSYQFALAQCSIKVKVRFDRTYEGLIESQISNIEINSSEQTKEEFKTKLAYHFMFRQSVEDRVMGALVSLTHKDHIKEHIPAEIGCNIEVCELLTNLSQQPNQSTFVFIYKSRDMAEMFKKTLMYKIRKHKRFQIEVELQVPQKLQDMPMTSSQGHGPRFSEQQQQSQQTVKIHLFQDLSDAQFQDQIKDFSSDIQARIFLTTQRYLTRGTGITERFIEERYENQKVYFQLFFLDCRRQKPWLPLDTFKKQLKTQSPGLTQIRQMVRKKNNH